MTQQTGIAGVVESPSAEHNAPVQHRWDDLDYVRHVIATGGSYNAMEVLKALESALEFKNAVIDEAVCSWVYTAEHDTNPRKAIHDIIAWNCDVALDPRVSNDAARIHNKRRRALLWLVAERKRRRDAEADLADAAEVDSLKYREAGE